MRFQLEGADAVGLRRGVFFLPWLERRGLGDHVVVAGISGAGRLGLGVGRLQRLERLHLLFDSLERRRSFCSFGFGLGFGGELCELALEFGHRKVSAKRERGDLFARLAQEVGDRKHIAICKFSVRDHF